MRGLGVLQVLLQARYSTLVTRQSQSRVRRTQRFHFQRHFNPESGFSLEMCASCM